MSNGCRVEVISDDLIFQSQINAALRDLAVDVRRFVVGSVASVEAHPKTPRAALAEVIYFVDMNSYAEARAETIRTLRATSPLSSIIAFCSHEDIETQKLARSAGAQRIIANSALTRVARRICSQLLSMDRSEAQTAT